MNRSKTERLDRLLVERGLARNREEAKRLILSGSILVNESRNVKPGQQVEVQAEIRSDCPRGRFVSRGGDKLQAGLTFFKIDPKGHRCADFGASTGGFTHCFLEHGAAKVYAFDVGYGQFAWSLRNDPRVVLNERCNVRYLKEGELPCRFQIIAMDLSFISLEKVLPVASELLEESGALICLVKPQFEIGKGRVGKRGVVRNPEHWREVLVNHRGHVQQSGLVLCGLTVSPLKGPAGNVEFLSCSRKAISSPYDYESAIEEAIDQAAQL